MLEIKVSKFFSSSIFLSTLIVIKLCAISCYISACAQSTVGLTNHNYLNLPDFTSIVEKVESSVVNIRTMTNITSRESNNGFNNNDPYDFFRWFFGPQLQQPIPIYPPQTNEEKIIPRGMGSGFFISNDGYILTNNHVIMDSTEIIVTLDDGKEFIAKIVGTDDRTDIALLKIESNNTKPVSIGKVDLIRKGQWVLAIGSPFGLDSTVTAGIVSAIGRDTGYYLSFIQADVAVNPGNSGGPLLNLNGEVIGVNSQIISRSGGFMGISLSIPIDEAMRVAEQLQSSGKVIRGRIGVHIGEISREVADALGLIKPYGALVSYVEDGSPADIAGVLAGDVILSFNNENIKKYTDLPRIVGQTKPGSKSTLGVFRHGKRIILDIKIGEVQSDTTYIAENSNGLDKDSVVFDIIGLKVSNIPDDICSNLRINGGVLVKGSFGNAASCGLRQGDIILAINEYCVNGVKDFGKYLNTLNKNKSIALLVRRGEQTQWIPIKFK
ncbi:serine protease [Candidatus Kinetoplastibacterium oncopeltii TCC290E]|uniref:Probable periplasmic serine endoprotease DegP-like n=1 Tax=Candidatus Kinetoplastidibacterium stringomonadis TCC290E TaxID=1208920 RepID=M1LWK2_9PROT|nr:Do family serine endopeptidase [Candidatus Kinetoplastibacterium oncopeltii]AGF48446.1 serine protease [Candidatus Kinetoplastibacterium oncopeltii TCC290E]